MKTETKVIIFGSIIILGIIYFFADNTSPIPQKTSEIVITTIKCDFKCEKQKEEESKIKLEIEESMKNTGCKVKSYSELNIAFNNNRKYYYCFTDKGVYELEIPTQSPFIWKESEESKNNRICPQYKYSKLGDLPVNCLDYYHLISN